MRRARSSASCARCARTRCRSTTRGSTRRWIPPSRRPCSSTARRSSRRSTPPATGRPRIRDCRARLVARGGSIMKRNARVLGIAVATLGAVACLLGIALAQPAANEVLQWNETTMKAIEANGQSAVQSTRTLAMVQGAVHDALNAINRRYDAYYFEGPADAAASQFWRPGPPALTSPTYARDFNEVKNVGGKVSTVRTADQTEIARFWFEGPGAWNTIARTVAVSRSLDARDSARLLALMNMAMADAYIAGFRIRYVYDSWRPITAIREGDNDGNDATAGDPTWDSHQNTPAVSDYPSTQSVFSGAASVVLASVLGGDQAKFTVTSGKPFEGIKRSFTSFSQTARESADSRVYAGIHFRSACEDGLVLGRKVGQRAVALYLQPVKK